MAIIETSLARRLTALAFVGLIGVAVPAATGARAETAGAVDPARVNELLREFAAPGAAAVAKAHEGYVRRLEIMQGAVRRCDAFLRSVAGNDQVTKILRRVRELPGWPVLLRPDTVPDLERAIGRRLPLSAYDLELCLQTRDRHADVASERAAASESAIPGLTGLNRTLRKCLATLDRVGPNPAVDAVLRRVGREIATGDEAFTSANTLAALNKAAGRNTGLTATELEACVGSYHEHATLEPLLVTRDTAEACVPCGASCCFGDALCLPLPSCATPPCLACYPAAPSGGSCFPADATVRTADGGSKAMRDVRLGDRVQVARSDGSLGYEEVYLNTHKDAAVATPYVTLTLASGRALTLSPRHFIPVAAGPAGAWGDQVVKGGNEVRSGDFVWSHADDGRMVLDRVVRAETRVAVGAYNPLTLNGTIVVDGVVASAHSNWFLDGVVSADIEAKVYQAVLAPVRLAYRVLGPERMAAVTEEWGVVDFVRERSMPGAGNAWRTWTLALAVLLGGAGIACALRRRRGLAR
jgi:hypothetical protein